MILSNEKGGSCYGVALFYASAGIKPADTLIAYEATCSTSHLAYDYLGKVFCWVEFAVGDVAAPDYASFPVSDFFWVSYLVSGSAARGVGSACWVFSRCVMARR